MMLDRAGAILMAAIAGMGLLISPVAVLATVFLFDAPGAGGWPVWLTVGGMLVAPPALLTSVIAALASVGRPTPGRGRLAIGGLLLPLVPTAIGVASIRAVCGGSFVCTDARR